MNSFEQKIARLPWLVLLTLLAGMQLVFWQDIADPFGPMEMIWIKLLMPLCLLPLIAVRADLSRLTKPWAARLMLGLLAWIWIAGFISPYQPNGFKTAFEYSLYACIFFVVAVLDAREREQAMAVFLAACLVSAFYGLSQAFGFDPWRWNTDFDRRPLGTIGNPNFFAGHLVMAWGAMTALFLAGERGRRLLTRSLEGAAVVTLGILSAVVVGRGFFSVTNSLDKGAMLPSVSLAVAVLIAALGLKGKLKEWVLSAAALILMTAVQILSMTVGAWLGMAASLGALILFLLLSVGERLRETLRLTRLRLALGMGTLVLVGLLAGLIMKKPAQAWWDRYNKGVSVTNRLMMWRVAGDLWKSAPVTGAGWGTYRPEFPRLQSEILQKEKDQGWNYVVTWMPHENYLYWLAEAGVIGLALFLLPLGFAARAAAGRLKRADPLALAALIGMAGMLGESLLNTFSNIPPSAVAFWFLLGLLAWHPSHATLEAPRKIILPALGAAGLLALIVGVSAADQVLAGRAIKQAGRHVKRDDHAGAVRLYQYAADLNVAELTPQSIVGLHYSMGQSLRSLGRLGESVAAYREDLKDNPYSPELNNMLGANLGQLSQMAPDLTAAQRAALIEEAKEHLRTAIRISPGYESAMVNLGIALIQEGKREEAAHWWRETLKVNPSNADAAAYLEKLKAMEAAKP